jgi:hypothetical protein
MLREGEDPTDTALWTRRRTQVIAAVHAGLAQMSVATRPVPTGHEETELRKGKP